LSNISFATVYESNDITASPILIIYVFLNSLNENKASWCTILISYGSFEPGKVQPNPNGVLDRFDMDIFSENEKRGN
jgi:hypothetical protein